MAGGSSTQRDAFPLTKAQRSKCESLGILIGKPKHRQYGTLDSRIKSYENENWIKDKIPGIKELAEAGLVYTGVADSVRCYYCSIGLKDWPKDACPWEQHIIASPDCGHVAQCKGKAYVRKILGVNDEDSDVEVDDSNGFVDTVKEAIKRNEEAVTAAKQYYTNEHIINKAVKLLIKTDRLKTFSSVELIAAIEEVEKESKKGKQTEQLANNSQAKSEDVETDGSTSETDEEDEEELNRQLKEPITCKICFNAIACIITLPCSHMVSCPQCIPALTKCAVCGVDINGTVRAIMAI
ncbi:baculoviral IAP repeat-containing protein 2-like [Ruditapes philippinarum]|uniref:baculoviral IAP repeat-containing protein 2-like n=1 Tax=Ruditapes philippinarum TaxID=129788 RepID=UPI00295B7924|nr:baculoviral IAP repeat-containing protein 2-like [Ruditapes philippinarum]XP_060582545.1 baculoviral IAP repeat-containing protein 2-like [Ruditapes philippinarum]